METPEASPLLFVLYPINKLLASFNQLLMLKQGRNSQKNLLDLLMQLDSLENFYEPKIQMIPIQKNHFTIYPKFD